MPNYPLGRKPRANQRLYTGVLHIDSCGLHEWRDDQPTEMETDASANISDTTAVVPADDDNGSDSGGTAVRELPNE